MVILRVRVTSLSFLPSDLEFVYDFSLHKSNKEHQLFLAQQPYGPDGTYAETLYKSFSLK